MRTIRFIFVFLLVLAIQSCNSFDILEIGEFEKNGLSFNKVRFFLDKNTSDTLFIGALLKNPMIIQGFPCEENWVYFSSDWKIKKFRLAQDYYLGNNKIPKKAWFWYENYNDEKFIICNFNTDTYIQNYLLRGNNDDHGDKGFRHSFYLNGKLRSFYPRNDVIVNSINCKADIVKGIGLYENGRLRHCKLAEETKINGETFKKGKRLYFDENGDVVQRN